MSFIFCFYSEDGFYTTWVKAPSEGGQWSVEAVSMSPFHGLRKAQSQPLLRTMPISVAIGGIPRSLKRAEILRNVTIRTRNNMPVPMQVRTYSTIYHHNVPHTSYNVCSLMWKKLQLYFFLNWMWKLSFRDYSVTRSFQQTVEIEHNLIIKVMRRPMIRLHSFSYQTPNTYNVYVCVEVWRENQ